MIEQISVIDSVHTAVRIEKIHVTLQFFTPAKRLFELFADPLFLRSQFIGRIGIDGRKIFVRKDINFSVYLHFSRFIIDFVQKNPFFHMELGTPVRKLPFQL